MSRDSYKKQGFEFVKHTEKTVWYNNNPLPFNLAIPYSKTHPSKSVREFLKRKIKTLSPSDWIDWDRFEKRELKKEGE